MERTSKREYYLAIAKAVALRSTCLRRRYGAIIVNNDEIVSTGYNGAPRGEVNCTDCGFCRREQLHIPKGERYELCRSVHAEQNAIISASRSEMLGGTIYVVGLEKDGSYANPAPCTICRRLIVNAGIDKCVGMFVDGPREISLLPEDISSEFIVTDTAVVS
jgi:dCMP deaminase